MHDTFHFSLLDGVDNIDMQDKKTVTAYLNKHPKLEKRPGEKGYFLKGYDFIRTEAIKLGATACYFADNFWIAQYTVYPYVNIHRMGLICYHRHNIAGFRVSHN